MPPALVRPRLAATLWIALLSAGPLLGAFRVPTSGEAGALPWPEVRSSVVEQVAMVASAFVIKPVYMTVALLLIWALRRRGPEARLLAWALAWFYAGESFCAANMILFGDASSVLEYLHSLGMLVCSSLVLTALWEWIDFRVMQPENTQRRCPLASVCSSCCKGGSVRCRLHLMSLWIVPSIAILCAVPLLSDLPSLAYVTDVFGTRVPFLQSAWQNHLETRLLPLVSLASLLPGWLLLASRRPDVVAAGRRLVCFGAGALGFGLFRLCLNAIFANALWWGGFWEEMTEFLFIAFVTFSLVLFGGALFPRALSAGRPGVGDQGA